MKRLHPMNNLFMALLLLFACQATPEPIAYGTDNCYHCKMTISDKRYGTEVVTQKGKAFKFDSVECMTAYLNETHNAATASLILVTDYARPGELINANSAIYLQSPGMSSPMGMNLAAFSDKNTANQVASQKEGKLLTWEETRKTVASHKSHH